MTPPRPIPFIHSSARSRTPVVRILIAALASFDLAASAGARPAQAQDLPLSDSYVPAGVSEYDDAIPRPDQVLGYLVGERHTRPDEVIRYFEAVADASDRVRFEVHGSTHEGRPLVHAIVSSPSNLARQRAWKRSERVRGLVAGPVSSRRRQRSRRRPGAE